MLPSELTISDILHEFSAVIKSNYCGIIDMYVASSQASMFIAVPM